MFVNDKICEFKKLNKMIIIFILGPIGAGKSCYIKKFISLNEGLILLSSDNLMKEKNIF